MRALMHVAHAVEVAEEGESGASDPLRQSTLNAAEVIRKDLRDCLGTDLTVDDPHNPLFHSGCSPNTRDSSESSSHRPSEFLWRVAEGRSTGPGRSKPESWERYVDRFLKERLWF